MINALFCYIIDTVIQCKNHHFVCNCNQYFKENARVKLVKTIWVIGGGPSTEFEISLKSAITITKNINVNNIQIRPVMVNKEGRWLLSRKYITPANPDTDWVESFFVPTGVPESPSNNLNLSQMFLNLVDDEVFCVYLGLHGQFGEDGCVQGLFETAGIPYTGSGVCASALSYNKLRAKEAYKIYNLNCPKHITVSRRNPVPSIMPEMPAIVKPSCGGSSVGVTLVKNFEDLGEAIESALNVDSEALIEQYIPGVEVSCSIIDKITDGVPQAIALPPTLIKPVGVEFFDYHAKYEKGGSTDQTPAPLQPEIITAIKRAAITAHIALGCEGLSRTDMIISPKSPTRPFVLETNTLPGMTETSLLPQQAAAANIALPALLQHIINFAVWHKEERDRRIRSLKI